MFCTIPKWFPWHLDRVSSMSTTFPSPGLAKKCEPAIQPLRLLSGNWFLSNLAQFLVYCIVKMQPNNLVVSEGRPFMSFKSHLC